MKRIDQTWLIGSAVLTHSLDCNGDLSTLSFGFQIANDPRETLHGAVVVPSPMYHSMGGDRVRLSANDAQSLEGTDFIGMYGNNGPNDSYAIMRTTQEAIFRLAQLFAGHIPLEAQVVTYHSLHDRSGIIAGFTLDCIDLTPDG